MTKEDIFKEKMAESGVNQNTIQIFTYYYNQLLNGEKGKLSNSQISSPDTEQIIDYNSLSDSDTKNLKKLAVIKLNGGLGTSMGLSQAKSLLPVKDEDTFLDIIAKQTLKLRDKFQIDLPLIFMNSFNTSDDTLNFLQKYNCLKIKDLPLDFLQNKFPKVTKDDYLPLQNPVESQNWNPPGHGDIYNALCTTGLLDKLLELGFEYIFVSNSDNLGAIVDPKILNKLIEEKIDFAMEVCDRTEMDKKGGHLAKTLKGGLVLREVAQCPDNEIEEFQNIELYKYFNTNNLWINLKALQSKTQEYNGALPLPLILNEKKVDSVSVYQFETAMGAAISLFDNAKAICVPRKRFLPVKKTQDLLLLWSDIYELDSEFVLTKKQDSQDTYLELDNDYYGNITQLRQSCKKGVPSLFNCKSLKIKGAVKFGKNLVFKGKVNIASFKEIILEDIEISGE